MDLNQLPCSYEPHALPYKLSTYKKKNHCDKGPDSYHLMGVVRERFELSTGCSLIHLQRNALPLCHLTSLYLKRAVPAPFNVSVRLGLNQYPQSYQDRAQPIELQTDNYTTDEA